MAELRPFAAYRPPSDLVSRVACPPYDVVSTERARTLAAGVPESFLHVTRGEIDLPEGADPHGDAVYAKCRENLDAMVAQGWLAADATPRLYVYRQRQGRHRQTGVVACASVAAYLEGRIKKHEKTRPDKEDDRTRHIEALAAHAEPVFLTYRAVPAIDEAIGRVTDRDPEVDFEVAGEGVRHQVWMVEGAAAGVLERLFDERVDALYVADGHHRSAAAARVHQAHRGDGRAHDGFLAVVFPHDQMNILAYNRLVKDAAGRGRDELLAALRERLDVVRTDAPPPDVHGAFGLYLGEDQWYRATALPGSFDPEDPVRSLDGQVCQDLILGPIFGVQDPRRDRQLDFVGGVYGAEGLQRPVDRGDADLAIYLHPTEMEQIMRVSDLGAVLPPKSTWFEPKLRSGLFVHRF
ncbi:MAG: DUF1015 family protein [Myxococcota bacterium]